MKQINYEQIDGFKVIQYNWEDSTNNEPCDFEVIIANSHTTTFEMNEIVFKTSKGNHSIEFFKKLDNEYDWTNSIRLLLFDLDKIASKLKVYDQYTDYYSETFTLPDEISTDSDSVTLTIIHSLSPICLEDIAKQFMSKLEKCAEYYSPIDEDFRIIISKNQTV